MHLAHHAREHRAVAHAGVEHADRGRARVDVRELHADAPRDDPLLAAGIDEQQVLLPVVEKAEIAGGCAIALRRALSRAGRDADQGPQLWGRQGRGYAMALEKAAHAIQGFGGDAGAVAQPRNELAVVDRAPAERVDSAMPLSRQNAEMLSSRLLPCSATASMCTLSPAPTVRSQVWERNHKAVQIVCGTLPTTKNQRLKLLDCRYERTQALPEYQRRRARSPRRGSPQAHARQSAETARPAAEQLWRRWRRPAWRWRGRSATADGQAARSSVYRLP